MVKRIPSIRVFPILSCVLLAASTSAIAAQNRTLEAESAECVGGASKVADGAASGGYLIGLAEPGQGIQFAGLSARGYLRAPNLTAI